MRDDSRPADAFAWTRPWVPYGDDPFVWFDPSEDIKQQPAANDGRETPRAAAQAVASAPVARAEANGPEDEIWVELPAAEERPKRARRGRGRGRGTEAPIAEVAHEPQVEAPIMTPEPMIESVEAVEPAVADAPPARKPRASRAKAKPAAEAVEPELAAVATVPAEPAPEPAPVVVAREPDPAEISTPPAAPRKGWWRRG